MHVPPLRQSGGVDLCVSYGMFPIGALGAASGGLSSVLHHVETDERAVYNFVAACSRLLTVSEGSHVQGCCVDIDAPVGTVTCSTCRWLRNELCKFQSLDILLEQR